MKGDVLLHHDYIVRLTWSLPPHSPAGGFAPKPVAPHYYLSRHYFFSAGLTSKPHHAHNDFALLTWIVLPATGLDFQPQTRTL